MTPANKGQLCVVEEVGSYHDLKRGRVETSRWVLGKVRKTGPDGRALKYSPIGSNDQEDVSGYVALVTEGTVERIPAEIALRYAPREFETLQAAVDFMATFRPKLQAVPWPNGQGWDVGPHRLTARPDGRRDVLTVLDGTPYRALRADAGEDPVQAVRRCLTHGAPA